MDKLMTKTKMILPGVDRMRPSSLIVRNHMLKQKPPRKHPIPLKIFANGDESPARMMLATIVPTA
jgi:hypothetical protein